MQDQTLTLEERYRAVAEENRRKMNDTIRMANRCDELGAETLARLAMDREKLLRVDQELDYINDSLKRAEYHLHSMESWSGAIGNYFRGAPKAEKSGTWSATKKKLPKVPVPDCPSTVWRGKEISERKVKRALEELKIHNFVEGEHIMYFCSNAGLVASSQKAAADCVVMTNLGVFQVVGGKRVGGTTGGLMLRSVREAKMVKGSLLSNDRVLVATWSKRVAELTFWNRKSSEFMTALLNQIPSKSREWQGAARGATSQPSQRSRRSASAFDEASQQARTARDDVRSMRRQRRNHSSPNGGGLREGETSIERLAREHDEEFNGQLDELSSVLDNVAFQAKMMGDELTTQNELTAHIKERVEDTRQRTRANERRGKALLRG
mmetsp:Transcript_7752/g.9392  ORF Transcript_7752/g.9392 Transcript_7752/m.9392 type:complete len:380 (-) Transcript_7752:173-1312(-)